MFFNHYLFTVDLRPAGKHRCKLLSELVLADMAVPALLYLRSGANIRNHVLLRSVLDHAPDQERSTVPAPDEFPPLNFHTSMDDAVCRGSPGLATRRRKGGGVQLSSMPARAYDLLMKEFKKLFWSIPAVALYFYIATVLMEYGYASYFNIPSNYVSASISDNIIYFFQLFTSWKHEIGIMSWWVWIVLFLIAVFIVLLWYSHRAWRVIISIVGTVVFVLLLASFYNFGQALAAINTGFWIPAADCTSVPSSTRYVAPISYGEEVVFVPIDASNTLLNGILVKNAATLDCELQYQNIGKIKK
jgi:hypothetical protein